MAIGKEIKVVLSLDKDGFSVGLRDANGQLKTIAKQMEQTSGSVKRMEDHMHSFGQKMHRTVMTLGMARFALMDVHDIFLAFPKAVLKTGGEVERLTKLMEGLSSETDKVKKKAEALANTKFLFNMAQNAPFEVKAIGDAFVKLKTGGLDPTNGSLQALIDGVSRFGGTSDHLHRASIAIQQMGGKGKISMEELRQQIGEAVPNAMEAMAQGFDMTVAELDKAVSKGTVSAAQGLKKMLTVMGIQNAGAAAEMMGTWTGMLEQLKTKWELFKLDIGGSGMFDTSKAALQELLDAFNGEQSGDFARSIGRTMNDIALSIINATKTVVEFREEIGSAAKMFVIYWGAAKAAGALAAIKGQFDSLRATQAMSAAWTQAYAENQARSKAAWAAANAAGVNKVIVENQREIAAEKAKTAALHTEQLRQLRNQIATNEAILAANRKRILEAQLLEQEVARSAAVRAVAAGTANAAQDLEAQVLMRKAEQARNAADQAGEYSKRLAEQTVALQNQRAALENSKRAISDKARALMGLNGHLRMAVEAHKEQAAAITKANTAMGLMGSAAQTVIGGIRNMLSGMNGLIIAIMAVAYAWDFFSSKAKKAAEDAQYALNIKDMAERQQTNKESIEGTERQIAKDRSKVDANNVEIALEKSNPLYHHKKEGAAMRARVEALEADNKKLLKAISDAEQGLAAGKKDFEERTVQSRAYELQTAADTKALKAIDKLQGDRSKIVEEFKKKTAPSTAETEAYKKSLRAKDVEILEAQRTSLLASAEEYRKLAQDAEKTEIQKQSYLAAAAGLDKRRADLAENIKSRTEDFNPMAGKDDKDKGKGLTPTDDLLSAIARDKRKLTDATQEMDKLNGEIVDVAALRKQANEQVAQIVELDRHRKIVHKPEDVALAEKLRFENLMIEDALKLQSAIVPKVEEQRERLRQLQERIASGDYRERPVSEDEKMLAMLERRKASLADAAAAMDPVIAKQRELLEVGRSVDVAVGIIGNERNLQDLRIATIRNARERIGAEHQREIADVQAKYSFLISKAKENSAERVRLEQQMAEEIRLTNERLVIALESPLDRMSRDWEDTYEAISQAQANWGEGFVDMLTANLGKGRMEVGAFVRGVLQDIVNAKLKEQLALPLNNILSSAGGALMGGLFAPPVKAATDETVAESARLLAMNAAAEKATEGLADVASKGAAEAVKGAVMSGMSDAKAAGTAEVLSMSFMKTTSAAEMLALALQQAASAAGGNAGGSLVSGLLGGMGAADYVSGGTAGASWTSGFDLTGFANGGIMTGLGPVQLRKYANGGIANSPQLALYGEGSMHEAYVPLPDGRSIPVTMRGGQQAPEAPSVTVNVINQSGQQVNAQQGNLRFDGKGYILDVVMTAANAPGPFRDNLKNAVKG